MFSKLIKTIFFFLPLIFSTEGFDCSGMPEKVCSLYFSKCNWGGPLEGCMNRYSESVYNGDQLNKWVKWKHEFNKTYSTLEEDEKRFVIFLENLSYIKKHENKDYKVNVNHFSDLSRDEWLNRFNKFDTTRSSTSPIAEGSEPRRGEKDWTTTVTEQNGEIKDCGYNPQRGESTPSQLDWRNSHLNPRGIKAVNDIKNQQQCGSCWAFSTIASVEGAWALSNSLPASAPLVSLSEQQLVDCSAKEGNQGCNGGLMDQGFQYIIDNNGVCSETEYPYKAQDGQCIKCKTVARISSYFDVQPMNETAILVAIQNGPLSIAIEADQQSFQFYSGGIYSDIECGTNLDHGVNLVGYGNENGKDYWILRNSWGTTWGENGYMRILRGKNICGLSQMPSMPVV